MKKTFIPLINKQTLHNGFRQSFEVNNQRILLIQENDQTYLIENKCGHFGVKLDDAIVEEKNNIYCIICKEHGISFNLVTGEVINRPWENCDPIKVIDSVIEDDMLGYIDCH